MTPCRGRWLYPAEIIDLLKGLIIVVCVYMMTYIDTSMMYHLIKSQSVIKLYLFYNMLEVSRLFSSIALTESYRKNSIVFKEIIYVLSFTGRRSFVLGFRARHH